METPAYPPYTNPGTPNVPMPPRLHWGWLVLLSVLTRSFFNDIWLLVQTNWICKLTGNSDLRTLAIVNLCKLPFAIVVGAFAGSFLAASGQQGDDFRHLLTYVGIVYAIGVIAIYLFTVFKVRAELESAPIGIPLGGAMTFFFGPIYFQYFLRDWVPMAYSPAVPYPQYTYPTVPPQA